MDDVKESMDKKSIKQKPLVEAALGKYCDQTPAQLGPRERKICYYISPMKRETAHPFSLGMASNKICQRIDKQNPEICAVKFPVVTEKMEKQDLSKLRVKQLKSILLDRGVECRGCVEKEEFVKKVQDTEHLANTEF